MWIVYIIMIFQIVSDTQKCMCADVSSWYKECKSDVECNEGDKCLGVCVDSEDSSTGMECFFNFIYWYYGKGACGYRRYCTRACTNGGVCKTFDDKYAQTCFCGSSQFFGSRCQYERQTGDPLYFRMVQWLILAFVKPGVPTTFSLLVTAEYERVIKNMMYLVDSDLGYIESRVSSEPIYSCAGFKCAKLGVQIMLPFLLPANKHNVTVYKWRDRLRGYPSQISVSLKPSLHATIHTEKFPVFVDYFQTNSRCIPVIVLKNCGQKLYQPGTIHRNVPVDINYVVHFYTNDGSSSKPVMDHSCTSEDTTFMWSWSSYICHHGLVKTSFTTFQDLKSDSVFRWLRDTLYIRITERTTQALFEKCGFNSIADNLEGLFRRKKVGEKIGHTPLRIEPYTLDFGLYIINLRAKKVLKDGLSENFDECFIEIKPQPIRAIIDGGDEWTIVKEFGLRLSASKSHDPNQPAAKQDLYIEWSCECLTKNITNCEEFCKSTRKLRVYQDYFEDSDMLAYNAVYKFTLTVYADYYDTNKCPLCKDISPQHAYTTITVADESVTELHDDYIECVENCNEMVKTNEILLLKVKSRELLLNDYLEFEDFEWTYTKSGGVIESADAIMVEGLPVRLFAIKEDALEQGVEYTIILSEADSERTVAKYKFVTHKFETKGECTIEPNSGIAGVTLFDIKCFNFENSLVFEFYDKSDEDLQANVTFNGRLLGALYGEGSKDDVLLTRGNVVVYIINDNGLFTSIKLKVELSPLNITEDVITDLRKTLEDTTKLGMISRTLGYISFIPDVIPPSVDKNELLSLLVKEISKVPLKTLADIKIGASTLYNVLISLNKPRLLSLNPYMMLDTLKIIKQLASILRSCVVNRELSQWMSPKEIRQVATTILESLNAGFKCKDKDTVDVDVETLDFETEFLLEQNARRTEEIVDLMKDILSYIQAPGLPPSKIADCDNTFSVWAMEHDNVNPVSKMLSGDPNIPIGVSKILLQKYEEDKSGRDLIFQVSLMEENVFYWTKPDVDSKLVSVNVATRRNEKELRKIEYLSVPITVRIAMDKNLTNMTIAGRTTQLDPKLDPLDLDLGITIHRIDAVPKGFLMIRFVYPPTNESLRVFLVEDYRPDYKTMLKESMIINSSHPDYPMKWQHFDDPVFLYMGVLPGPNVSVNKTVDYTFEISTTVCMMWTGEYWSSVGCSISFTTTADEAHCECTHLSIFAAAFPIPPQSIDPFGDIKLFLNVLDNPIVVVFITTLLLTYLLLLLWARRRDNSDKYKGVVVVLEDNFPSDKYPYLVAVYTSARFNAGTTAHVGIKLIGKEGRSRAHVLSYKHRKLLKRNSDDWFIIYSPRPLGDVYGIHLWHDNSGSSPEWLCEKIIVYDISERTEWIFIVEQWLGMRKGEYPEANILLASNQDMLSVKRLFLDNCILGFRDDHTFLSVFVRHPRSEISRTQRISVLMCSIMVAMLCSIMFYRQEDEEEEGLDDFNYDVGTEEVIISIQTLFITVALTFLVLYAFRKSFKIYYEDISPKLHFRKDELGIEVSQHRQKQKEKNFYNNYVHFVAKYLKNPPFTPVSMWESEKKVEIRKIWYTIAWVSCISVIGSCAYLVMLYGLKLGFVESEKWLTTLVMCMGEEIFVMGPGKIILIAILLSMAFQRSVKVDLHGVSIAEVMEARPPNESLYLNFLLAQRSHPMYAPISTAARRAMLESKEIRGQWWALIDFTNAVCFVIVVSSVIDRLWTSRYHDYQHLESLFINSHYEHFGALDLDKITNVTTFETYLDFTFVEKIFNLVWYNGESCTQHDKEPDGIQRFWMEDGIHKMIGKPMVRQVRVVPWECRNRFFPNMSKCLLRWSLSDEDTDLYEEKWAAATYDDQSETESPWDFTDRKTDLWFMNQRFYGTSGILYDVSGYLAMLGPTEHQAELMLQELEENDWQDWHTRAVFLELTLYNVNEHLFSQVTILVEYFTVGTLSWSFKMMPVSGSVLFGFWEVLFLFYAIYYVFRSAYLINHKGLIDYLQSVNNVCRVIVVILAWHAIVIWCIHHRTSTKYAKDFLQTVQEDYFDFDTFIHNFSFLQVILTVLLCFGIVRAIMLLRGGRSIINPYYTFLISLSCVFWLFLIFVSLLVVFSTLKYFFNTHLYFRTKELVFNHGATDFLTPADFSNFNIQMFVILRMILMYLLHMVVLILFLYFTRIAKVKNIRESDFNFALFVGARLKEICYRKKG